MAKKVLIVEDDTNIAELLHLYLEKEGLRRRWPTTGARAWSSFAPSARIWCCWTLCLPVMDGWSVLKKIREK